MDADFLAWLGAPPRMELSELMARSTRREFGELGYFDFEVIPDWNAAAAVGIKRVPPPPEETPLEDMPTAEELVADTIGGFKKQLAAVVPSDEFLTSVSELEAERPSPRSGISEAIEKIRKDRFAQLNSRETQNKSLATNIFLGKVCAIGWAFDDDDPQSIVVGDEDAIERDCLEKFAEVIRNSACLCGFNIASYDVPLGLWRSSIHYDIPIPKAIDRRPWGNDLKDIYAEVSKYCGGTGAYAVGNLKSLAAIAGLDAPEESGADVLRLHESQQYERIHKYVRSDVRLCQRFMSLLRGSLL